MKLTKIGGYGWSSVEGEGCTIFTHNGEKVRGSILLVQASGHVYGAKFTDTKREDENMEVRLDIQTTSEEETRAAGIEVGDFVAFDPRVEITNGFVRSRHLDDKACVANLVAAIKALSEAGLKPQQTTTFHFSNYEEVGHGAATGHFEELVRALEPGRGVHRIPVRGVIEEVLSTEVADDGPARIDAYSGDAQRNPS